MAEIVLGIGASHGPTIQSQPEDWLRLGQKDMEDPRYDFDAVLASASPEIKRELEPDVLQRRYESIQSAIESMSNVLQRPRRTPSYASATLTARLRRTAWSRCSAST